MRIAIPANGKDLQSSVADRFARAEFFIIYDDATGDYEVLENVSFGFHGAGPRVVQYLASQGVDVMIVPGMGQNAFGALMASGLKAYLARPGSVKDNIELFKQGKLEEMEAPRRAE